MPDSPSDDPFADLFSALPDPRSRALRSSDAGDATPRGEAPEPSAGSPSAPLSRREAREAAARAAGDHDDADEAVAAASAPVPVPANRTTDAAAPVPASSAPTSVTPATPAPAPTNPREQTSPGYARSQTPPPPPPIVRPPAPQPVDPSPAPAILEPVTLRAERTAQRRSAGHSAPGLEDLFAGATTTDDLGSVPPPVNKRRRRIGGWIALSVVLVLLGGIAAGGWYVWSTYEDNIRAFMGWEEPKDYEAGLANGEALLTIVSGDTGRPISSKLFEAGVTKTDDAFYDYLVTEGLNPPFVPGVFKLQKQMTSAAALEAILDPANKLENTAQLREGLTVEQSLPILSESIGIPLADLQAAAADPTVYGVPLDPAVAAAGGQPLEGWLFPATYTFNPGVTAQEVISTLVNRTIQSLDAAGVPVEDRQRILTTASIIEREARYEADMQKVSRVIQNRLDPANQETFGKLQMDSTAQFGYGEMHDGTASSSQEALDDDNPWNTYVHTGLPVGPISNPGDTAIAAAMSPADGDWLYFVTVNLDTGETVFTSNLADHNRAVQQWISWCRDNPDSGC